MSEVVGTAETATTMLQDENEFIQAVVLSFSDNEVIMQVISHVLLVAAGRCSPDQKIAVELPESELNALGLNHPFDLAQVKQKNLP